MPETFDPEKAPRSNKEEEDGQLNNQGWIPGGTGRIIRHTQTDIDWPPEVKRRTSE
jgi:hypothetical protein